MQTVGQLNHLKCNVRRNLYIGYCKISDSAHPRKTQFIRNLLSAVAVHADYAYIDTFPFHILDKLFLIEYVYTFKLLSYKSRVYVESRAYFEALLMESGVQIGRAHV